MKRGITCREKNTISNETLNSFNVNRLIMFRYETAKKKGDKSKIMMIMN